MKFISAILIALALGASPATAGDFFASNTHMLVGEENTITAEYAWKTGKVSGYGFVDKSLNSRFAITDHEVRANVAGPFYLSAELGYNHFGGTMGKLGVGINVGTLPLIRTHFVFLNVYAQKSIFGPDSALIFGFAFESKSVQLTPEVSMYASGFADFKRYRPDVVQQQLWLRFDSSPIEVGTEVSFFGKQASASVAIKMKF